MQKYRLRNSIAFLANPCKTNVILAVVCPMVNMLHVRRKHVFHISEYCVRLRSVSRVQSGWTIAITVAALPTERQCVQEWLVHQGQDDQPIFGKWLKKNWDRRISYVHRGKQCCLIVTLVLVRQMAKRLPVQQLTAYQNRRDQPRWGN